MSVSPVILEESPDRPTRVILPADPVENARELARQYAPADMRLGIALTHGTDLDQLEWLRASSRLVADYASRRLAVVGLKAGESLSLEPSDKFVDFLERWRGGVTPPGEGESATSSGAEG